MNNKKLDKLNSLISKEKSGWLEKAKWREENEDWLDISFEIAVKILGALRKNKKSDTYPKNQKQLAEAMDCSPQYVNKVLKGSENLQLETILKIGKILNIQLIQVPTGETTREIANTIWYNNYLGNNIFPLEKRSFYIQRGPFNKSKTSELEKIEVKGISYYKFKTEYKYEEDIINEISLESLENV